MFLKPSHYAAIPCKKEKADIIFYQPFLLHLLQEAEACLHIQHKKRHIKDLFLPDPAYPPLGHDEKDWRNRMEHLNHTPVPVPRFPTQQQFDTYFDELTILPTELFEAEWGRSLGSARHLNLGRLQLKGCGLTLPLSNYDFEESSGLFDLHLAIKSYILSTAMQTVLPLGCSRALGVLALNVGEGKHQYGVYLRELAAPRLAQISLRASDPSLKKFLPFSNSQDMLKAFSLQLASMTILGGQIPGTPDNILINGQFIDEETWSWPKHYGHCHLYFDFAYSGGTAGDFTLETLPWEKLTLRTHSFKQVRSALHYFTMAMNHLFQDSPVDGERLYLDFLQELLPELGIASLFEMAFSLSPQALIRKLAAEGWAVEIQKLLNNGLVISLSKEGAGPSSGVAKAFHARERQNLTDLAKKLSFIGPLKDHSENTNNVIMETIGRSGFLFPKRIDDEGNMVNNSMPIRGFLTKTLAAWPLLSKCRLELVAFDGEKEVHLSQVTPETKIQHNLVPLFFITTGHGSLPHILPCLKTLLTP